MKTQHKWKTILVLTLGLCLAATAAFATDYKIINSTGGAIQAKCSQDSAYTDMANGTTADFTCSGSSNYPAVRAAGSTTDPDMLSFSCRYTTAPIEITVSGTVGSFTYSPLCPSSGSSSS